MAALGGSIDVTLTSADAPDVVRARLLDRARIVAATDHVERFELIGDDVIHYVLKEQNHGVYKFKPDYRARYWLEGDTVRWEPLEPSNLRNRGSARVVAQGAGSVVQWKQEIQFELDLPRLVMPVVRPIVDAILAPALRRLAEGLVRG